MLDALAEAQRALTKVIKETILNCLFQMACRDYGSPRELVLSADDIENEELSSYLEIDDELVTSEITPDEDIIQAVKGEKESYQEVEDEEQPHEEPIPSQEEIEYMCKRMRRWIESCQNAREELNSLTNM